MSNPSPRSNPTTNTLQEKLISSSNDKDLENQSTKEKSTFLASLFNMFNQLEGLGLLGVPYAFKVGEWWTVLLLIVTAIFSNMTGKLLSRSLYDEFGVRVRKSYHEAAEAAFQSSSAKLVVATIQLVGLVGVAITFIVLIASSIVDVAPTNLSHYASTAIATGACVPLLFFERLSYVAYLSVLGVGILIVILVVVPISAGLEIDSVPEIHTPSFSNLESIGLLIFAFSAHSMFPEHENAMKNPSRFPELLNYTYFIITIEKLFFGIIAWVAWQANTEEIVTKNLGTMTRRIVSACIGLNTWLTLPMIVVVFFRILNSLIGNKKSSRFMGILQRTFGLFLCGLVAALLPHFAVLMSCFGAASGVFLTFICPVVIFLRLHKASTFYRVLYASVAFFGTLGGVVSLYLSVKRLVDEVS